MTQTWYLGVDIGTTWTAAAAWRDDRVEIIPLGDNQSPAVPTVVYRSVGSELIIGEAAARRAATEPGRVAREFKRRLGDAVPLTIDGSPVSAEQLYADVLRWVVDRTSTAQGSPPARVAITHPANWGPYKLELLDNAARIADVSDVVFVTEPEAAAVHYAADGRVQPGEIVAVYDLGGGTFDACLLEATDSGFQVMGRPEGVERLGGIDFDEAVFDHVRGHLGDHLGALDPDDEADVAALLGVRRECTLAKEALSSDTAVTIPVLLPGSHQQVRMTRDELEARLTEPLQLSVDSLTRAIRTAGLTPSHVGSVLLVGGSSRIPMVGRLVTSALGRPVAVDANPKFSIALGAARLAHRNLAPHASDVTPPPSESAPAVVAAAGGSSLADQAAAPASAPFTPAPPTASPVGFDGPKRSKVPLLVGAGAGIVVLLAIAGAALLGGGDDGGAPSPSSTTAAESAASSDVTGSSGLVGEEFQLNDNFGFAGYVFDLDRMVVTPPTDEFSSATVTIFSRVENRGFFAAQITAFDLEIDGIAHTADSTFFTADPGTTTALEIVFKFAPDQAEALARLDEAVLTVGEPAQNQAVVPVGENADFGRAARHAFATESRSIEVTYGPGDRYGSGALEIIEAQIGASAPLDLIAAEGKVWFGLAYSACVDELDGFLRLRLVLPDGEKLPASTVTLLPDGTATRGEPLATACPTRNDAIAYFLIDPDLGGTEVTIEIDDELTTEHVVGSFTTEIPVPLDESEFA